MSRNMCKWRHKVRNGPSLPPWSPNVLNYFFNVYLRTIFFTNLRPHHQNSFFYTFVLFSIPSSRYSTNMSKWPHKFQSVKQSVGPPLTWWNEAWYIQQVIETCCFLIKVLNISKYFVVPWYSNKLNLIWYR